MSESVHDALLDDLSRMPAQVQGSARAKLALKMAEAIDNKPSAIMAKELAAVIDRLEELAPPKQASDGLDDLQKKRALRRASQQ